MTKDKKIEMIVKELENNQELYMSKLETIAQYFQISFGTFKYWRKTNPKLKRLLDERVEKINSFKAPKKEKFVKGSSENLYNTYLNILKNHKEIGFSMKKMGVIQKNRVLLNRMGLYECIDRNSHEYEIKEVTEREFMEKLAEIKEVKLIYIFDTENNLVDYALNYKDASRRTKCHEVTVKKKVNDNSIYSKDFYFSYDSNFKITAKKPKYDNSKLLKVMEDKSNQRANELNDILLNNPEWHHLTYNELAEKLNVSTASLFRYFQRNKSMNHWIDTFRKAKQEFYKNKRIQDKLERKRNTENKAIADYAKKVVKARIKKKSEPKKMSVEELIQKQKEREKKGLKIVRKDKRDYEQLKKDLKKLVNK